MHISEFAVYGSSGDRVNLNIEKAGVNVNMADLSVGQYTVNFADNSGYGEISTKLFDGNTGTKLYWANVQSSAPLEISMRLDDTVTVGGYNFCTANGLENRDPVSWTVEYSKNGVDWYTLDAKTDFNPTTTRNSWYDGLNGTSGVGTEADYFRVQDIFDSSFLCIASPDSVAPSTPSPAYGNNVLEPGQELALSCGATPCTNQTETIIYSCSGWKLYDKEENLYSSGAETSFTYTHPNPAAYRMLKWQWTISEVKGTVTAGENGSVSPSGTAWFPATPVTVTATPSDGFAFSHWEGNLPSGINANDASVTFTPTAPFDMTAVFASAYYVATNGNDGNPGTKAQPFATIGAAVTAAKTAISGGSSKVVVFLADGEYNLTERISVDAPISIVGESGNRDAVVVRANGNATDSWLRRTFALNHATATVSGLTALGGGGNVTDGGGNIYIGENGGIVKNCVVANGRGYYGGNIAMGKPATAGGAVVPPASALIVDCVISNGTDTAASGSWDSAGNIFSNGGRIQRCVIVGGYVQSGNGGGNVRLNNAKCTVENCLITGGSGGSASASLASGIAVNGNGRVVNCTIVGNTPAGTHRAAVRLFSEATEAKIVNCVIYGNGDSGQNLQSGFLSCYVNCAFSSDGEYCADTDSPVTNLTADAFKDYANGDYRPVADGVLFNAGNTELYLASATSATDLGGAVRISKNIIDIGCYEASSSAGLLIYVR